LGVKGSEEKIDGPCKTRRPSVSLVKKTIPMQTTDIQSLAPATLALLGKLVAKAAEKERDHLPVGKHDVSDIVTLKLDGTVKVSADTERAPTCSIPMLPAMALLVRRMGLQREKALELLAVVMKEALTLGKDASEELLKESGVADAMAQIQDEVISKLPKTPAKGQVKTEGTVMAVAIGLPSAK
jgi:hypothetical protein